MNYPDSLESSRAQGGGYPPGGYGPPGAPPPGGYGPPGAPPPGGYGPPGGGGYGPPGGGGYGPPGGGGYGPPGGGGYGPPGGHGPPAGAPPFGGGFAPPPYQPGSPPPGGQPGFEATEALAFGWAAVTKDYAGVAVPLVAAAFVSAIPGMILGGVRGGVIAALSASGSVNQSLVAMLNVGGSVLSYLIGLLVQAFILGGVVQFALRVARGEKPDFGVVFSGGRFFAPMLGATLIYTFCSSVGLAFCILPGLFLMSIWVAYSAFIVDRGLDGMDALKASIQLTAPHRTNVLVYTLLSMLVVAGGLLACCVGALLLSFPILMIGNAYLYLKLIGEQPRLPGA
ncbi:MAG TPA: hypothetical protein VER04_14065 [Polyangiaceae bacterium]|nr:hypothetical protein [Polyangiaceae bacterium]